MKVTRKMKCCEYAPWTTITTLHFFITYEWTKKARILQYAMLERLAMDKQSSLLGLFVSNTENEMLRI